MKKKYKILIAAISLILIIIIGVFLLKKDNKDNLLLIENKNVTLLKDTTYTYKAICTKNNCNISYKSLNENIFSVTLEGEISAKEIGEGTLEIESGNLKKQVSVIVTDIDTMMTALNIKEDSIKLNKNDKYLIELETFPNKTVSNNFKWTSSDLDVITIDNGYVIAKNEGEATITVTTLDGSLTDSVTIIVGKGATEEIKSVSFEEEIITVSVNELYQLNPIIRPINSKNKELTYVIENEDIVSIENGVVKGKSKGETTVTAISKSGISGSVIVKVEPSSDDLAINGSNIVIARGEEYQLRSNYIKGVEWYSSNDKVATVSSSGLVKGISNGDAIISVVNSYGRIDTIKVNVKGSGIPVSKIVLNKSEVSIRPGGSYKITYTLLPSNATNKEITWETNDSRIATVNKDGTIIGLRSGETTIIGYTSNQIEASIKVIVTPNAVSVDNLEISPSDMTIVKGDTYKLNAKLIPSNATNKNITWESSDDRIVSVNEYGEIKGEKVGTAVIKASVDGLEAVATIEVKTSIVEVTSVRINESDLTLKVGDMTSLSTTIMPNNSTNKSLIWESNSDSVSVTNKGVVTGLKKGTAVITVSSTNGRKDTIKVTVEGVEENPTNPTNPTNNKVTEILLNLSNVNLHIGQTKQMKATVLPLNAINNEITWVSSNNGVVTVSSSGLLTGINPGTAQISAISENGKVAKTTVTVTYPPIYDSGVKEIELYSDKLIVTTTSNKNVKIIRVWVADPYNQFHKVDTTNNGGTLVSDLLNSAIYDNNLVNSIMIGSNASLTSSNRSKHAGNLIITEGVVKLNNPGGPDRFVDGDNTVYYGINSEGLLKAYYPAKNAKEEANLFARIINDGVKNTMGLTREFVTVLDGKISTYYDDPRYAIRNSICQVNKNNFIFIVSDTSTHKMGNIAQIQQSYGCKTGLSLDGGGSVNVFYKSRGATNVTAIRSTTRPRSEAIYFSEY